MPTTLTSSTLRVLLVDDSIPVRQRIRSLIEESGGIEVVGETNTAAVALTLSLALNPHALVLAHSLSGGDASLIIKWIKDFHPECLVIVLCGCRDEEREAFRQAGANHVFDKSKEFERVPEVLREFQASEEFRHWGGSES